MKKETIKIISLFVVVFVLIAYSPFRNYKQNGEKAIFSYFAGDAFYYLNVADNYAKTGIYTYDGEHPSNGFHPLWQFYLAHSFKFLHDMDSQIFFTFISSLIFTAIGYWLILLTLYNRTGRLFLSIPGVIPGLFFMFFAYILSGTYNSWSFINGMESSFSILFFGLFIYLSLGLNWFKSESILKKISLITLLLFISFSRLDDSFLLFSFVFFNLLINKGYQAKSNLVIYIGIPFITFLSYFIYNYLNFGFILPVSGMVKSGLALTNFLHLVNLFTGQTYNYLRGTFLHIRIVPLLVTVSFGLYILFDIRKKFIKVNDSHIKSWFTHYSDFLKSNPDQLFWVLSLYLVLKGFYNFIFVDLWDQGTWYFVLSVIIFNFIITEKITRSVSKYLNQKLLICLNIFILCIFCNGFVESKRFEDNSYYKLWQSKYRINHELDSLKKNIKIIEMDDGIISYSLEKTCLSGLGLNLDKQMWHARSNGRFLDEAYSRGYRYIASLNYFRPSKDIPDKINSFDDIAKPFFALNNENLTNWRFTPFYKDEKTRLVVIEFFKHVR